MSATDGWRTQLEAWALPDDLLSQAEENPYGLPVEMWRRRARVAAEEPGTPTARLVVDLLSPGGRLLDVGAGMGRASLPAAHRGHPVTAVEARPEMTEALTEATHHLDYTVVAGRWPEVSGDVPPCSVAVSAHVMYDVQDPIPFIAALDRTAAAVVIEISDRHPWHHLAPFYRALHRLDRPDGPTSSDLAEVIEEAVGIRPEISHWSRPGGMTYADMDELLSVYRRRLVLPAGRTGELRALLEPIVVETAGGLMVQPTERNLTTLWWRTE